MQHYFFSKKIPQLLVVALEPDLQKKHLLIKYLVM